MKLCMNCIHFSSQYPTPKCLHPLSANRTDNGIVYNTIWYERECGSCGPDAQNYQCQGFFARLITSLFGFSQ